MNTVNASPRTDIGIESLEINTRRVYLPYD